MASTSEIVQYTDDYLRVREVDDWPNALNGLQIQNSGRVSRIGATVDASTESLTRAAAANIDFLIVHHGLFWSGLRSVTGILHRQLDIAFKNDIALYSAHLPLDIHPRVGNNAELAVALGLKKTKRFFLEKGELVGVKVKASQSREQIAQKLGALLGQEIKAFRFGPQKPRAIGIITGAAGSEIFRVAEEQVDTFITGEAPHWAGVAAQELGMNLLLGGHYATETFGVKALARHLSKRFKVPWSFIDCPTGL